MKIEFLALLATIVFIANILSGTFGSCIFYLNIVAYIITILIYFKLIKIKNKKERLKVSEKLLESKDRYKLFLDKISEGVILIIGQDNTCQYANRAFLDLSELKEAEVIGETIKDIFSTKNLRDSNNTEIQIKTKSGKMIDVIVYSTPVYIKEGEEEVLVSITDITENKKLEKDLRDSKQKSLAAFDSAKAAVIIIDQETNKVHKLNDAACQLTGYERSEVEGQDYSFLTFKSCLEGSCELSKSDFFANDECLTKKDGKKIPILKSVSSINVNNINYIVETIIDISARKKYEELTFRNEKFKTIGTLASGVAHEFNNINAIIKGRIEEIFINNDDESIPSNIKKQLKVVKEMISRSSAITTDLLMFSDNSQNGYNIFRPIDLIDEIKKDIASDLEEYKIQLDVKVTEGTFVYANPNKLHSVFCNLISNATHSMVESKTRKLSLICSEVDNYHKFVVKDTGCGISEKELPNVFDPFFSNKGIYAKANSAQSHFKAKGLGLSLCQTIMEKHHNGKIEITSDVDVGTEVSILIPKATEFHIKKESLPYGRPFLIAVFDPNLNLGPICKRVFDLCGYITIEVSDVDELIGFVNDVDMIVMDQESIYQEEVFSYLFEQNPKTPIILLSDEKEAQIIHEDELGISDVFSKPYLFKTLAWSIWNKLT